MTEAQEEKELILGNKQLISLFFVVVALCGVCFAMGYIIGHNSSKPGAPAQDSVQAQPAPAQKAQDSEPPRETATQPSDSTPADNPAPDASQPDNSASAPSTAAVASGVSTQPGRDIPQQQVQPETEPTAAPAPAAYQGGGSYLQVGAVSKPDAENLVKTLREQSLPAIMAESPKKGLYRVLVGPYHQTSELAEAKSKLKALGFDNAFVQR